MAEATPAPDPKLSCPICLASSADRRNATTTAETSSETQEGKEEDDDIIEFLVTPCEHVFCKECIERVLIRPRGRNGIPTRAPCPLCREEVDLFDLRRAAAASSLSSSPSAYAGNSDLSSWPVASYRFKQRCLLGVNNPEEVMQKMIEGRGVMKGFGIRFCFNEVPSMDIVRPARPFLMAFDCDWTEIANRSDDEVDDNLLELDSVAFDRSHFHRESMTFHGKISFANPTRGDDGYFYERLSCLLHFSGNGNYIRRGNLRWKFAPTSGTTYPLDGTWEVQFSSENSTVIYVQTHFFNCFGTMYNITIDEESFCPRISWPGDSVEQISDQEIWPGTAGPGVDETLEWRTNQPGLERIVWKRKRANLDDCWRSVDIISGNFVYQKCNQHSGSEQPLGPSYRADSIWGNTFCQAFCVGLASYHFLDPSPVGNLQAFISYENPRTEMFPCLDNNETVPSRVPFRNIAWEPETRTFKGDICWEQDYGTTWMNESKWSYRIVFDPTFMFVVSGTCTRSMGAPHQFGNDLIYINAALEIPLRETLQTTQSTGEYLNVMRRWRDDNASSGTLEMMGEVAMAVMGDRETMFDFNL
mmetsp:Transcript_6253/g.15567  ORF Transcript_6253/g.15567 Transcript_6253/m.15567 type:complete len:586 (+) Transcript_6253:180-1937(+)|eukprot:CAMPEP_0181089332 /NCGR_PEP_ID=MMETSP1071-20121207/7249_1 /TAXON_ID=35127 /ORGANISM="Thalassiosira sp., Strain NH16" /LENGTH=585 /DNA_ID=CAMNT_0023171279 /DNA_START=151 /DNA_END=1908 /DNA_ORIENTATION=+